jgi:hypothetical protein
MRNPIARAATMLMHDTRGANAPTVPETPQFGPRSARGSGRPDGAAAVGASSGLSLVTDLTYSLIRGCGGEIDATEHSLRAGEWDRDFLQTLLAMAGHDLRQPLQIITIAHEILAGLLQNDRQRSQLARAAACQVPTYLRRSHQCNGLDLARIDPAAVLDEFRNNKKTTFGRRFVK